MGMNQPNCKRGLWGGGGTQLGACTRYQVICACTTVRPVRKPVLVLVAIEKGSRQYIDTMCAVRMIEKRGWSSQRCLEHDHEIK